MRARTRPREGARPRGCPPPGARNLSTHAPEMVPYWKRAPSFRALDPSNRELVIIYSVTVSVDRSSSAEWLQWMTSVHIPDVLNSGYFGAHSVRRVIDPTNEFADTFVIEYECESLDRCRAYRHDAAPALQRDHAKRHEGRFTASRRVMEIVE